MISRLKHNVVGDGLGHLGGAGKLQAIDGQKYSVAALDSGVLEVLGVMGWMGGALYTFALFGVVVLLLRERSARRDAVANGAVAAAIAILAAAFFGNVFNGVSGVMLWSAVGFALAGKSYALAVEQARRYTVQPGKPIDPAYARHFTAA